MWRPSALNVALALVEHPTTARQASRAPLPDGMTLLLQVAAGEAEALRSAQSLTRRSQAALQLAAGFFIEQVLFSPQADSYRILGASGNSPRNELRRNMALLIKWLHPDGQRLGTSGADLDRGIFIHRVTQAWENLKTDERRAHYDRSLTERPKEQRQARHRAAPDKAGKPEQKRNAPADKPERKRNASAAKPDRMPSSRLAVYRFERDSFLNRLLFYLQGRT
jgi:hypothetical protein